MLMNVVLPAPLPPIRPTTCRLDADVDVGRRGHRAEALVQSLRFEDRGHVTLPRRARSEHRPQSGGQEHDHQQHRDAEHHLPGVRRVLVREALDPSRRPASRGRARPRWRCRTRIGDEHEFARRRPVGEVGIDVADRQRDQPAADAGEHAGDHVVQVDDGAHRSAHVLDAQLVVADRRRERAGMRARDTGCSAERGDEHDDGGDRVEQRRHARPAQTAIARDAS